MSDSLSKLSDRETAAGASSARPPELLDIVKQRLDTHEADIQYLAGRIGKLETLGRHLRLQAVCDSERPFLIEANVPGLGPFAFEIHRSGDAFISTELEMYGTWEPLETEVIKRLCRAGDFVLDIGANIGWYSIVVAKILGPTGRLISFEPDPRNYAMLSRNLARVENGPHSTARQEAVSDTAGILDLFLSEDNLGDHRIFSDGTPRSILKVATSPLDQILTHEQRLPDLVKSDAQGSEAKIFLGAASLFAEGWRPIFVMEFWPFGLSNSGDDPLWLWSRLAEMGYQMFELTEDRKALLPIDDAQIRLQVLERISPRTQAFINLVAFPNGSDRIHSIADVIAH